MPLPTDLVVKKGSKARFSTSGAIPSPVSATATQTSSGRSQLAVDRVSVPPSGHRVAGVDRGVEQGRFELRRIDLDPPQVRRRDRA